MIVATMCVGGMYQGTCYSAVFPETERLSHPYQDKYYIQIGKTETGSLLGEEKSALLVFRRDTDSLIYACELDETHLSGFASQDRKIMWNQVRQILKHLDLKKED